MIRLIATDMDGTFLDSNNAFDQSFFPLFEKMQKRNIHFVIASGNQYHYLYKRFLPVSDDLYFIAENGSYIAKGKEMLYHYAISPKSIHVILSVLENFKELMVVVAGIKYSYILNRYLKYEKQIKRHYEKYQFVDSYDDIDDEILKISLNDHSLQAANYTKKIAKQLPSDLKIMTSGNGWMDIMPHDIDKGTGLLFLQNFLHVSYDECAIFGDQMNDYGLFQNAKYSYAMANAVSKIKDIAYQTVLSNNEQGVLKKISEILEV